TSLSNSAKLWARLVAFANSTMSGCPTAASSAATTTSNGLGDITLSRSISILLIAILAVLPGELGSAMVACARARDHRAAIAIAIMTLDLRTARRLVVPPDILVTLRIG